jgi:hypothetical protein
LKVNNENCEQHTSTIPNETDFQNGERIMSIKVVVSILLPILLVSCAAPETENSTQVTVLESPQPTPLPERADIGDGGLLSGLPCAAPCVYGIRIGETPLDQVIPILEQNGLSECQKEESASWIGIICGYSVVVQVDRATSVVNSTGFFPSVPISLKEIIEKYREPDFVLLQTEGSAEAPTSRMSLFWDEFKMTIEMPHIDSHIYALEGTTTTEMVIFLDEAQYIDSSEISFGEYYKRWNGYGAYQP